MGAQRGQMKMGFFLGWFVGLVVPVQEIFCSALAALFGLVQNIFFLIVHYFHFFVPSVSKLGRQPCWVACLLLCVYVAGYAKNSAAEKRFLYQPFLF
jgi:hypothetical protein